MVGTNKTGRPDTQLWSVVPPALRALATTAAGDKNPITENDFSPYEKSILQQAIVSAEMKKRNYITYSDYGSPDPWATGTAGAIGALTNVPASLGFTIGSARFERAPDGSVVINDRYDYGASRPKMEKFVQSSGGVPDALMRGFVDNGLLGVGNVIGNLVAPEGEGRNVRIALPAQPNSSHQTNVVAKAILASLKK